MTAVEERYDPDRPVIEAIGRGDAQAMAEFIGRQERYVRGIVFGALGRRDLIDDVVQQVWIQVWRQAGRLTNPEHWRIWLYRIARNAATDVGRRRQRRQRYLGELWQWQKNRRPSADGPDRPIQLEERHQIMLDAIAQLPDLYREPFVLKHLEDWSYREIGEALGLPTDTVETRLVRARRLLRQQLAGRV